MLPEHDRGRPGNGRPQMSLTGDATSIPRLALAEQVDHFRRRVMQDAYQHARRVWWLKRSADFEAAKPRPDDYTGQASLDELRARWRWCHETAKACRAKAEMCVTDAEFDAELQSLLIGEVSG
jgi:hypothetical protein